MGEQWLLLWVISFVGLLIIAVTIYDYLDRRKRNEEVKLWKYALALIIGLILMYPVLSRLVMTLPKFFRRR